MNQQCSLATVLRSLMDRDGWTPQVVARIAGISKETLKNWLSGATQRPYHWQPLIRLAAAMRLSRADLDWLLEAAQQPLFIHLAQNAEATDHSLLAPWLSPPHHSQISQIEADQRLQLLPTTRVPAPQPLPTHSRISFRSNPQFVGRAASLGTIATLFKASPTAVVVSGAAGMGKTQLAVEMAHRYGAYFAGGVYWISCVDPDSIPQEIANCGDPHGLVQEQIFQHISLDQQVQLVRAAWHDPIPRLIIFDQCEDPALLQQWRPTSGGARLLVTSRYQGWPAAHKVHEIPLTGLDRAESRTLLGMFSRSDRGKDTEAALEEIADAVGHLPLVLFVIGNYLHRYREVLTPLVYLQALQAQQVLHHPSLTSSADALSPTRHDLNIVRSLLLLWQQLHTSDPINQMALRILSCLAWFAANTPISRLLLRTCLDVARDDHSLVLIIEDGIRRITTLGLITDTGDVFIHPLIRQFLQLHCTSAADQRAVEAEICAAGESILLSGQLLPMLQVLHPHVQHLIAQSGDRSDPLALSLHLLAGSYALVRGDHAQARAAFDFGMRSIAMYAEQQPLLHAFFCTSDAHCSYFEGRYDVAEAGHRTALALLCPEIQSHQHLRMLILNRLGSVVAMRGEAEQALRYFQECAHLATVLGNMHIQAAALNNQANMLRAPDQTDTVLGLYERGLAIHRAQNNLQGSAATLHNLGIMARLRGDYPRAQSYLDESLDLARAIHYIPLQCSLQIQRGMLAMDCGDLVAAAERYHQALALTSPARTVVIATLCEQIARWYVEHQRWEEAALTLRAGDHLRLRIGVPREASEDAQYQALLATIRQHNPGSAEPWTLDSLDVPALILRLQADLCHP